MEAMTNGTLALVLALAVRMGSKLDGRRVKTVEVAEPREQPVDVQVGAGQ